MVSWSNDLLIECYNSIQYLSLNSIDETLLKKISDDLNSVFLTPTKNEQSKQRLLDIKTPLEFSNGDSFKLNEIFVENAMQFSNDFDVDEVVSAEILYYANTEKPGISFGDQGKKAFFLRYQYILNILGYLITTNQLEKVVVDFNKFGTNILNSFSKIYKVLDNLNDLTTKQNISNTIDDIFIEKIQYSKRELLTSHEILGEVLYNLVEFYFTKFGTFTYLKSILQTLNQQIDQNDAITLHYFPALLNIITNVDKLLESDIIGFHSHIKSSLSSDFKLVNISRDIIDLANSKIKSFEIMVYFLFLTNMIPWCKQGKNYEKFHFNDDILYYIQITLNYGVLENLLRLTSETADEETTKLFEVDNLCDFRKLLQVNLPDLTSIKFGGLKVGLQFTENLLPFFWHKFFINFITHVAIILTQLRDSEEDFLLSSFNKRNRIKEKDYSKKGIDSSSATAEEQDDSQLDFQEIYARADLERFYLSFVYTYKNRPQLCSLVWEDEKINNELLGFITWGINNNSSPLITATFCLLLSSLTSSNNLHSTSRIWESLVNNNSLKRTDYSKISIDSIIESLNYYLTSLNENFENDLNNQIKQKQKRQEFLFSNGSNPSQDYNKILIELSDDSIIFISGFILLISSIAKSLSNEIKANLYSRFKPVIIGFLKFDNLIINSQISIRSNELPKILIDESTRSVILNLMFEFLDAFHDQDRYEIWEILDRWMFHDLIGKELISDTSVHSNDKVKLFKNNISIKHAFKLNLLNLPNILNFTRLIDGLLEDSLALSKVELKCLYPINLGVKYRANNSAGIWPYFEFLIGEVLSHSNKIKSDVRKTLQLQLLSLLLKSLSIDLNFLYTLPKTAPVFKFSDLFNEDLTFELFLKSHNSISVLNFLYEEKAYGSIFDVVLHETDDRLVLDSLRTLEKMIEFQGIFKTIVLAFKEEQPQQSTSLVKASTSFDIYYPSNFNLINFVDILSNTTAIVTKLGLLVDSSDEISHLSIDLLSKINRYYYASEDSNLLIKNKMLTVLTNSTDSNRLKYSFANQLRSGNIDTKFKLLKFFLEDLKLANGQPSASHILLGYELKGNYLVINEKESTILSSLVEFLLEAFANFAVTDYNSGINIIDFNCTKLACLILSLFIGLCQQPITSTITLEFLRAFDIEEENLFEILLRQQVNIDSETCWNSLKFNPVLDKDNDFIIDKISLLTFFEFIKMKNLIIQYLTLEFHSLTQKVSIYKKNQYLNKLINDDKFLNESHQILKFLDILNFKFKNFEQFNYQKFTSLNLNLVFEELRDPDEVYDVTVMEKFVKLKGLNELELKLVEDYLVKFIVNNDLKSLQLSYLHSWVQLIEVIINDGNLPKDRNQNFILEILSSILPKINEFFEGDIIFSEELISLCVILFDYYEEDKLFIERLLVLFSTCIKGIISTNSTIDLRNDLYIIMNNFLQKAFKNKNPDILRKLNGIITNIDARFLEIICNDCIVSEGSIRVTSIILLESIVHLVDEFDNTHVVNQLINNNSLLLIIRSIKRIDEVLEEDYKVISNVLYELINYKSIINLLIRIGQVRYGSSYLIQSELFSIIKNMNILKIDPDLGFNLKVNDINKINLSLDSNFDFINYYEFLLPVFKLISVLLISMGPNYKPSKIQGKDLLGHFSKLRASVVKKDILVNENKTTYQYRQELEELINQFIVIDSLVQ